MFVILKCLHIKKITHEHLVPNQSSTIFGMRIIGDSTYPMQSWLMKPFAHNSSLTKGQRKFNYRICRTRIAEVQWRRLLKHNDIHTDNIPHVIVAACVLHVKCTMSTSNVP